MATFYALNKVTSALSCNIPLWACGSSEDFKIAIDYRGNSSGFNRPFGKNSGFVSRLLIRHDSTPGFFLTNDAGTSVDWPLPNGYTTIVNAAEFYMMEFVRTAGVVEFWFNGVSQGTRTLSGAFNIERALIQGGTHDLTNNAIKTFELTKTTDSRFYQNTIGTGIEWTDSVSAQTGLVQSPPGDDSQWLAYTESTSDQAVTVSNGQQLSDAPVVAVSQSAAVAGVIGQCSSDAAAAAINQAASVSVSQGQRTSDASAAAIGIGSAVAVSQGRSVRQAPAVAVSAGLAVLVAQSSQSSDAAAISVSMSFSILVALTEQRHDAIIINLAGDDINLSGVKLTSVTPKYGAKPITTKFALVRTTSKYGINIITS